MRLWARVVALVLFGAAFAACTGTSQVQPKVSTTPTPSAVPVAVSAAPSSSPADLPLTVDRVGASASPNGFLAFALVSNPSSRAAAEVAVRISVVSASGAELEHASATIARIDPSQTQAVGVWIPATLPNPAAFKASITGNRWLDPGTEAEPVQVVEVAFVQDPRTPTVRVRVANHAGVEEKVAITAVCLDAAGTLRGGGTSAATVPALSAGQDVWVPLSIPVVPTSCQGYVLTE